MSNNILNDLQNELYFMLSRMKNFSSRYTSSIENKLIKGE